MTGQTADISQLFELGWYEWVKYFDSSSRFPHDKMVLGRYLRPLLDIGSSMTAKILKMNGNTVHVATYRALTKDEYLNKEEQEAMEAFTKSVNERLGPSTSIKDLVEEIGDNVKTPLSRPYQDLETDPYQVPDRDPFQSFDKYIGAEVLLPIDNEMKTRKVRECKQHADGSGVGTSHENPLFDTRQYIVAFPDDAEKEYTANTIAKNMYAQCNPNGE